MLYALSSDESELDKLDISSSVVRHWLRHISTDDDDEDTHRFFMRLDGMFRISNSSMKSMRRTVLNWDDVDKRERRDVVNKLIQMLHDRAPSNSELLPKLKSLYSEMKESASGGATGASSIATAIGGLGAGFDVDGHDKSIYHNNKSKKPLVIRRIGQETIA